MNQDPHLQKSAMDAANAIGFLHRSHFILIEHSSFVTVVIIAHEWLGEISCCPLRPQLVLWLCWDFRWGMNIDEVWTEKVLFFELYGYIDDKEFSLLDQWWVYRLIQQISIMGKSLVALLSNDGKRSGWTSEKRMGRRSDIRTSRGTTLETQMLMQS